MRFIGRARLNLATLRAALSRSAELAVRRAALRRADPEHPMLTANLPSTSSLRNGVGLGGFRPDDEDGWTGDVHENFIGGTVDNGM